MAKILVVDDEKDVVELLKFLLEKDGFQVTTAFNGKEGQRFTWGWGLGRADHIWEGLIHYTSIGQQENFVKVIQSMTADERTLFRFPPPGHHYYTKQTLAALEAQYPGFNSRGEYVAVD